MIQYRVQAYLGGDWTNAWFPTKAKAEGHARQLPAEWEARIDKIDVPTDKEGLAWALNLADANFMNWEGERVA